MATTTKFDGCDARYAHQVERLANYLTAIKEPVEQKGRDTFQFLLETVVVMVVSFLEEYLKTIVEIGAYYREDDVRAYLIRTGNVEEQRAVPSANAGSLARLLATRVSFKKKARRLDAVFTFLFGFTPWPDADSARLIRDLVRVRNIIVHEGGWPNAAHYADMETAGIILQTSTNPDFYRLDLVNAIGYVRDALVAAAALHAHLSRRFSAEPKWHYEFPIKQFSSSSLDDDEE